jgi:hypothetical protein
LAIDIDAVEGVLIAGQWFEVLDSSFKIESYQYVRKFGEGSYQNLLASGREPLLPKRGFIFTTWAQGTDGLYRCVMAGPLTAIQAVRWCGGSPSLPNRQKTALTGREMGRTRLVSWPR